MCSVDRRAQPALRCLVAALDNPAADDNNTRFNAVGPFMERFIFGLIGGIILSERVSFLHCSFA